MSEAGDGPGRTAVWADVVRAAYDDTHARLWRAVLAWSGSTDVAEPSPLVDCSFGQQTNWDQWFRELLAASPQVSVTGQRALITAREKQLLLVRLD